MIGRDQVNREKPLMRAHCQPSLLMLLCEGLAFAACIIVGVFAIYLLGA